MNTNIASDVARGIRASNAASQQFLSEGEIGLAAVNKAIALASWAGMVGPHQDWDHKGPIGKLYGDYQLVHRSDDISGEVSTQEYYFDVWSNIHYGYVGSDVGFSSEELLWGAGIAQVLDEARKGFPNKEYNRMVVSGHHDRLDDPRDQSSIRFGIDLWNKYGEDLTRDSLVNELFWTSEPLHEQGLE